MVLVNVSPRAVISSTLVRPVCGGGKLVRSEVGSETLKITNHLQPDICLEPTGYLCQWSTEGHLCPQKLVVTVCWRHQLSLLPSPLPHFPIPTRFLHVLQSNASDALRFI